MTCILDDDEVDIEAEIQRELDALEDDSLHIEDVEDETSTLETDESQGEDFPDSIQEYLLLLQSRTQNAEEEVKECEIILEKLPLGSSVKEDEALLSQRIKEELGDDYSENPLVIRDRVLSELEETELKEERERLARDNKNEEDNQFALDIVRPAIIEEIQALEENAKQKLRDLEEKQAKKDQERELWYKERRQQDEARRKREQEARYERQLQFEASQEKLRKEQEVLKAKLEAEAREEEKKLQKMEEQFQMEIRTIEEEKRKQSEALEETKKKEEEYQLRKREVAATKLQKFYKGFRTRKQFQPILEAKKLERIKKRNEELDSIERVERKLREEAEKKKLEDEQRRREEKENRLRQEEERRKQEAEENERKLKEEQRLREEKKKKMEEVEKRRIEEEERRKEEARKKKEEEEKQREAEEKQQRIEEGKKREEEEKRKREEIQKKIEEEKQRIAEENKRKEEERKKKEMEENMRKEEERKRREMEENMRKEEERKRREEEERLKEEHRRKVLEEELKTKEEKEKTERERIQGDEKLMQETKGFSDQQKSETLYKEIPQEKREKLLERANTSGQETKLSTRLALTKELEARRLQWVKEHTPWSTVSTSEGRTHPVAMKSRPRRAFSAGKHLPALTEEQLLMSSPSNTSLHRVKCIALNELPSCSMQGLSQCPEVRSLSLQNCGLLVVEGLDKCKELQELHLQGNNIEAINIKDLPKLEDISLANNNLSSVHGLEGIGSIMSLDLSNNKITRIGDLASCRRLQKLLMDNNQLINTKGLYCLSRLQHLSLAHNHLARVSEIDNCLLLQTLNLRANNLLEPPCVVNSVLLRELRLDDNSISSLDALSTAWLPLLQILSVSQNSISRLAPLGNLIMMEFLDISNNLISDTDSLLHGLQNCHRIRTLKAAENPVYEDPNCRALILEYLPNLLSLDDEITHQKSRVSAENQAVFLEMCQNQLHSQDNLKAKQEKELGEITDARNPESVVRRLRLKSQHNQERFELAVRHLLEHENFSSENASCIVKEEKTLDGDRNREGKAQLHHPQLHQPSARNEKEGKTKQSIDLLAQQHVAATKIQALWRGWHIRHLIDVNTTKWLAAVTIQSAWRGYLVRSQLKKQPKEPWDPKRNSAATIIQAHFRGQRVRRRLNEALRAAQFYDDEGEEEFDYDEEVDLTAFDFDENVLEQGWTPSETPQLPSRGPVLKSPGKPIKTYLEKNSRAAFQPEPTAPKPRHAWRSADSPITDVNQLPVGKATIDHDQMSVTSGLQSHLSHRAEELSSEWGFRSSETAELMMRRAKKMKYNPARRKKLLDPNKRLALFKKLEETNKLQEVKPPPTRRQPPNRVEYFAAREAMASHLNSTSPTTEKQNREKMTYSWVYRQAVVHEDEEKNIMADRKEYSPDNRAKKTSPQKNNRSSVNLPHMDPVVLSGRTLPLISSPHFSQSLEQSSPEGLSPRRNSFSSEGHVRFPAIKTHSVPNLLARSSASGEQPLKTEKSNSAGARINRESKNKR
nr:leucine-rich repeat and IQ domain-containing protein 1-like [Pocillopora verrucosa]